MNRLRQASSLMDCHTRAASPGTAGGAGRGPQTVQPRALRSRRIQFSLKTLGNVYLTLVYCLYFKVSTFFSSAKLFLF